MRRVDALLALADRQAREDLATIALTPARRLVTVIGNRARQLADPAYQDSLLKSQMMEDAW